MLMSVYTIFPGCRHAWAFTAPYGKCTTRHCGIEARMKMRRRMVLIAAAIACMAVATALPGMAEAAVPKALTPQQHKLKGCGSEWQKVKRDGTAKGTTWAAFRKDCLK